jgi:hypothetical protein
MVLIDYKTLEDINIEVLVAVCQATKVVYEVVKSQVGVQSGLYASFVVTLLVQLCHPIQ